MINGRTVMHAVEEIYHADSPESVFGSEQGGYRRFECIQNNRGKSAQSNYCVALLRASQRRKLPTHVPINGIRGLEKESLVLLERIRTVDKGGWMIMLAD